LKTQLYEKSEKEPWLIEDSQKETQTQQKDQVLQFDSNISQKLVSETPFNGYFYYFFLFLLLFLFLFLLFYYLLIFILLSLFYFYYFYFYFIISLFLFLF
jgi:hypothetical protein